MTSLEAVIQKASLSLEIEHHGTEFPAWYRMRFVEPNKIVFLVRDSVMQWFDLIRHTLFDKTEADLAEFGFKNFTAPNDSVWGYDYTIRTVESGEPSWVKYEIQLPAKIRDGISPLVDENYRNVCATAASISILLRALNGVRYDHVKEYPVPQLLTLQNFVSIQDMSGAMMGAYYSRFIVEWTQEQARDLNSNSQDGLRKVALAMKRAYCHMIPKPEISDDYYWQQESNDAFYDSDEHVVSMGPFRLEIFDSYLNMEVSHQVSLYSDGSQRKKSDIDKGYKLDVHNPDSISQQLNLIAGVAKLYEVVEEWYKSTH